MAPMTKVKLGGKTIYERIAEAQCLLRRQRTLCWEPIRSIGLGGQGEGSSDRQGKKNEKLEIEFAKKRATSARSVQLHNLCEIR